MTRRTLEPHVGAPGRRANRMVPGGRLLSETAITNFNPGPGVQPSESTTLSATPDVLVDVPVAPGPYATLGE